MEKYESAVRHHRSGSLSEAERLYREAVAEQPEHAQAWFLLSVLAMGRGDDTTALPQLIRAIDLAPNNPAFHSNLGLLYRKLGRHEQAAMALLRAVSLNPDSVEGSHNLGLVMRDKGDLPAALLCFERVAELKPDLAVNQQQLAQVLVSQEQLRRAVGHYQAALAIDRHTESIPLELTQLLGRLGRNRAAESLLGPIVGMNTQPMDQKLPSSAQELLRQARATREQGQLAEARSQLMTLVMDQPDWFDAIVELGEVLERIGDLDAALLCFEQATDLNAISAMAQHRLASLLVTRIELEIAIGHYQCAVNLDPECVEFIEGLAALYHTLERDAPAQALYRRALTIRPDWAKLHAGLGMVLGAKGQHDRAMECFERAIELEPDLSNAWVGRALAFFDTGRVEDALLSNAKALALAPNPEVHARHLYMMMYDPAVSSGNILEEARHFNLAYAQMLLPQESHFENALQQERRLRIGYVSSDFRNHCQSFFMLPLLSNHDHERFEVICYSTTRQPDLVTGRMKGYADVWHDVSGFHDVALAHAIREDKIDIVFDLSMHMQGGRPLVFARRPAPIQIAWLAYPGTTGLSAIDYRITDPHIDPPGGVDEPYVERSIRLPDSFWCYDPLCTEPAVGALPALETGYITFGCLNSFTKTNPNTFALWASVLQAVVGSRLLLLAPIGSARERSIREFKRLGIAEERLEFVSRQPRPNYLQLYHRIDVCLDTIPYNGHTTSLDATWMGVPVVTLLGNTAAGRAGACLAQNLNLPELVARSPAEYVDKAVQLCADTERLSELRSTLRMRMQSSPLMNAPRFTRHFEALLRSLWRDYCLRHGAAVSDASSCSP